MESYEYQLKQVAQAYAKDPTNSELITLKEELESLIKLTREFLAASGDPAFAPAPQACTSKAERSVAPTPAAVPNEKKRKAPASTNTVVSATLAAGEEILARYAGDSKFYPARILSVSGSAADPIYTVSFKGYDTTEVMGSADVKAMSQDKKRQLELTAEEAEKEKRRKKNEKKAESRQVKTAEQVGKQQAWQKFATKPKKGRFRESCCPPAC